MASREKHSEIDDRAAEWVVRTDRAELTDDERRERDAWLADDPRHLGAYARARAAWSETNRLAALASGGQQLHETRPERIKARIPVAAIAAAAALVVINVAAGMFAFDHWNGREEAGIGEVRRIVLDDGSVVTLNTASAIKVRYGRHARLIKLQKGEASFEVAHDQARPFVVDARGVAVRAVGTIFSVRMTPTSEMAVTVAEGAVRVAHNADPDDPEARVVPADHRVLISEDGQIRPPEKIAAAEISRRLSWQEGRLVFDGESVGYAAQEMNRYSETKIIIDDSALADAAFVGVFRIGDAKAFAETVAAAFDATITEENQTLRIGKT